MTTPILLTPGPLTTSLQTKQAMLTDLGSWDTAFNQLTASVCSDIVQLAHGEATHVCVPLQGSGTFAVEATLGSLVSPQGKVLVPNNGAYCQRIARILRYLGRPVVLLDHQDNEPADPARIDAALSADPGFTHVAQVHCETGTGILNPLQDIAAVVKRHRCGLIVDAMSSFGAVPIDLTTTPIDALIAASGKCLEGVPGMGFILVRRDLIESSPGYSHSLALDLHDQWGYMQKTGQWRFTPPTHVMAALRAAIDQFKAEGGTAARGERYQANCRTLTHGMRGLGLRTLLPDEHQSPIIVTFHAPRSPAYRFDALYRGVRDKGFILYPGKLTHIETFRVGCIGAIGPDVMTQAVAAIAQTLQELGVEP